MGDIEIDKNAALEQMYELMKKDGKYLEVKMLVPKIEEDIENLNPLGNVIVKEVGPLEMAFMIGALEQVIDTLREQHPKVKEAEEILKKKFKMASRTIHKEGYED